MKDERVLAMFVKALASGRAKRKVTGFSVTEKWDLPYNIPPREVEHFLEIFEAT